MSSFFDTKIDQLRGIGPQKAALLNTELGVFTYGDLLQYYPFRHEDRSRFFSIAELTEDLPGAQLKGRLRYWEILGEGPKTRLVAQLTDGTGALEMTWFKSLSFIEKSLRRDAEYVVYGKPTLFQNRWQISHPELELLTPANAEGSRWQPVYSLTEKLRKRYVDSKAISRWMHTLLQQATPHLQESLPDFLLQKYRLISRAEALWGIHLPENEAHLHQARRRLKFEELFYNQLKLIKQKLLRRTDYAGQVFGPTELARHFHDEHLPFSLTLSLIHI